MIGGIIGGIAGGILGNKGGVGRSPALSNTSFADLSGWEKLRLGTCAVGVLGSVITGGYVMNASSSLGLAWGIPQLGVIILGAGLIYGGYEIAAACF